jgi:hypothetical protein
MVRPPHTYRAARRNAGRSQRATALKANRLAFGMSRREFARHCVSLARKQAMTPELAHNG